MTNTSKRGSLPTVAEQYHQSRAAARTICWQPLLQALLPHLQIAEVVEATFAEDTNIGVDYWAVDADGRKHGIQVKHAGYDPLSTYGREPMVFETLSDTSTFASGWAIRQDHRADYLVYIFADHRATCVHFPTLRTVLIDRMVIWSRCCRVILREQIERYRTRQTQALVVPRALLEPQLTAQGPADIPGWTNTPITSVMRQPWTRGIR